MRTRSGLEVTAMANEEEQVPEELAADSQPAFAEDEPSLPQPALDGATTDASSVVTSTLTAAQATTLMTLWEGHRTLEDMQQEIDQQKKQAHELQLRQRAVLREVKKQKKAETRIRNKCTKLSTQALLRELEFRAEHKKAVAAQAAAEGASSSSGGSESGLAVKKPRRTLT